MIIDISGACGVIPFFRNVWIAEVLFEFEMLCNGLNIADNEANGYFAFQTIIDIAGAHGIISDVACVGSPVIINI